MAKSRLKALPRNARLKKFCIIYHHHALLSEDFQLLEIPVGYLTDL